MESLGEMHYRQMKTDRRTRCQLVVALLLLWGGLSVRANVYATDIKLDGSTNNAASPTTSGICPQPWRGLRRNAAGVRCPRR